MIDIEMMDDDLETDTQKKLPLFEVWSSAGHEPLQLGLVYATSFKDACSILLSTRPFFNEKNLTYFEHGLYESRVEAMNHI